MTEAFGVIEMRMWMVLGFVVLSALPAPAEQVVRAPPEEPMPESILQPAEPVLDVPVTRSGVIAGPLGAPVMPGPRVDADGTINLPRIESGIVLTDTPLVTVDLTRTAGPAMATTRPGGSVTAAMPMPDPRIIDQLVPLLR